MNMTIQMSLTKSKAMIKIKITNTRRLWKSRERALLQHRREAQAVALSIKKERSNITSTIRVKLQGIVGMEMKHAASFFDS